MTGEVGKHKTFDGKFSQDSTHEKSLKSIYFYTVIGKIKMWQLFWDTLYKKTRGTW